MRCRWSITGFEAGEGARQLRSRAFQRWQSDRLLQLDEIEASHIAVGGTGRGRRFATTQINHGYAVLLLSQFQGFCRDLHDESIHHFVQAISPPLVRTTIERLLSQGRKLDQGNPNPDNIGNDFNRFGLTFWPEVLSKHKLAVVWKNRLSILCDWRNAIAHQDFDPRKVHDIRSLTLGHVRDWRIACQRLANLFDEVMSEHLLKVTATSPW